MTNQERFYLGIDLGGTNIKAGVVTNSGESLSRVSLPTEAHLGPDHGVDQIVKVGNLAVEECRVEFSDITSIGLATPGTMDIPTGMLLEPPNLKGWEHFPIRQKVADRFELTTVLQNDANAAAYGEYWVGAGKDVSSMVLWTLGTGVGSGIIVNDMVIQGEHSHGSECGHVIIEMDGGRLCPSGQYGTLEAYVSAKSLMKRCQEALEAGRKSMIRDWMSEDEELSPILIGKAADAGDELAEELIMETARCLGVGTVNVLHTINPTMVLIGGAMTFGRNETELGRRFLARIKEEIHLRAFPTPAQKTLIDYATLGGNAGYIGAAGCARLHEKNQALSALSDT